MRFGSAIVIALMIVSAVATSSRSARVLCPSQDRPTQPLPPARFEDGPSLTQADLVSDFDGWIAGMRATNPDLSIRVDPAALDRKAAEIRRSLNSPMSRRIAWEHFALLNPVLRDAHAGVQMPDYREALQAHIAAGGRIVPIEVRFGRDGVLRVFAVAPGTVGVQPGDQVEAVNGHLASEMVREMLLRSIGDSDLGRRAWVSRRFAMLYWQLYGDTGQYDLTVRSASTNCRRVIRMEGGTSLPPALQPDPPAKDQFGWRILDGDIGYLRADGFDPPFKDALASFAKTAFTAFSQAHIKALIIDVRENGGGDDPLWQQSLMEYITTKPYAQLSRYVQRITKAHADPGDVVGTVRRGDFKDRFTPTPVNPIRFAGPVYILDGPYSYSATIQFLVAAQDFGIAKIAGEETGALSCQTGQVARLEMPRTGLSASTPAIAYTRPSGVGCRRGVMPDVVVPIDQVRPDNTLAALVSRIAR